MCWGGVDGWLSELVKLVLFVFSMVVLVAIEQNIALKIKIIFVLLSTRKEVLYLHVSILSVGHDSERNR